MRCATCFEFVCVCPVSDDASDLELQELWQDMDWEESDSSEGDGYACGWPDEYPEFDG